MRKFICICVLFVGLSTGFKNALAQSGIVLPFTNSPVVSLTNQMAFTNTVTEVTNFSTLQLGQLADMLLALQTNVEQTLPALAYVESAASFTNVSTPSVGNGAVAPITSNPSSLVSPTNPSPNTFTLRLNGNSFTLDRATLQAIVTLQQDLARALPVLQSLNGTAPSPTNTLSVTTTFLNPAVRSFGPPPLSGRFLLPLTNMSPFILTGRLSAF